MFRKELLSLINALRDKGEADLLRDIEDIINLCSKHIDKVTATGAASITMKHVLDHEEYRKNINEIESSLKSSTEALSEKIKILNRYCKMVEMEPIYKGDIENRDDISVFAMEVVKAMFEIRKL